MRTWDRGFGTTNNIGREHYRTWRILPVGPLFCSYWTRTLFADNVAVGELKTGKNYLDNSLPLDITRYRIGVYERKRLWDQ